MTSRHLLAALLLAALVLGLVVEGAQYGAGQRYGGRQQSNSGRRWAMYEYEMQDPVEDPPDAWDKAEFVLGRLRFRSSFRRGRYDSWGIDANKCDRQFLSIIRRLTRVNARSVEEIVDIDSDEMYNFPWLLAISIGDWILSDSQAARLKNYFERGGFLLVDDFHNEQEWANFESGMNRISPGHRIIEMPNDHPILHTVLDVEERFRVPGYNVFLGSGVERGGIEPHWRLLLDSKDRVQVVISFNQDMGDAWEYADSPDYPERYAGLAFKLGVNYVVYAMTH